MIDEKLMGQIKMYSVVCDKHQARMLRAAEYTKSLFPVDLDILEKMDDQTLSFLDQMIYRFSKLQDALGQKIFPCILKLLEEPILSGPFIDQLNRLDQLGLLQAEQWLYMREIRNQVAHEYPEDGPDRVVLLNELYNFIPTLSGVWESQKGFLSARVNKS